MIEPPVWSSERLEADRLKAIAAFLKERLEEPLEDYLEAFDEYQGYVEEVLETTVDLSDLEGPALDLLSEPHLLMDAQNRGLTIFWAHDLQPLTDWIASTK